MSTSRIDYIIYGWKLPPEIKNKGKIIDLNDDKFLPYIEGHKGIKYSLIIDYMCGKYIVFGKLIAFDSSGGGWDFENLNITLDSQLVKDKFLELFGFENKKEPKLFIFSNFS
jgi:hypothetical protein